MGCGASSMGIGSSTSSGGTIHSTSMDRRGLRAGLVSHHVSGKGGKHVNIWDVYEEGKMLGEGMTGHVKLVTHKETGEVFALKCMDVEKLDPGLMEDLKNEIALLKILDHPNVIKLQEYWESEDKEQIYLVLEYCSGGELYYRLKKQKGDHFSESYAAILTHQMVAAIAYCHRMGVSHRDLKLENFLFENDDARSPLKLIDFGLSHKYRDRSGGGIERMTSFVGTPYYMAPEVARHASYSSACDVWSIGVITYMLLAGSPPFKARGRGHTGVLESVKRGRYTLSGRRWEGISELAKNFIRRCLQYDPKRRPTADQLLQDPWLSAVRLGGAAALPDTIPSSGSRKDLKKDAKEGSGEAGGGEGEGEGVGGSEGSIDPEVMESLRDFSLFNPLKRAAIEAIAFSLSAHSIAELRKAFVEIDKDLTGLISREELRAALISSGAASDEEAKAIFSGADQGGTDNISYSEFLAAALSKRVYLQEQHIREAFRKLDVDHTGFISADNLRQVLGDDYTEDRVNAMILSADTKGDGKVDFEEFMAMMQEESSRLVHAVLPAEDAVAVAIGTAAAKEGADPGHVTGSIHRKGIVVVRHSSESDTGEDGSGAGGGGEAGGGGKGEGAAEEEGPADNEAADPAALSAAELMARNSREESLRMDEGPETPRS